MVLERIGFEESRFTQIFSATNRERSITLVEAMLIYSPSFPNTGVFVKDYVLKGGRWEDYPISEKNKDGLYTLGTPSNSILRFSVYTGGKVKATRTKGNLTLVSRREEIEGNLLYFAKSVRVVDNNPEFSYLELKLLESVNRRDFSLENWAQKYIEFNRAFKNIPHH